MAKRDLGTATKRSPSTKKRSSHLDTRPVYIVDGSRTAFLKARNKPGPFSASDLAVAAGSALLMRQPFGAEDIDEVVIGCMLPSPDEANIGRVIGLRLGCGFKVPGWTVQRNCGSGLQALDSAAKDIAIGRCDLVLAGGTDAMSHAPLLLSPAFINWLADWHSAKRIADRAKLLMRLRPSYLSPVISLLRGLSDPIVGLSMGQTAEQLAYQFHITREQMDQYALTSHQRLAAAEDQAYLGEIVTVYDDNGQFYSQDDGLRRDSSIEKLAALKPFFDKPFGIVTAGNSSQVTDGAALLILASAEAVERYQLPVLGRIVDIQWGSLDPGLMGLGPVYATTPLLQRQGLKLSEIDYWEINEAFAAQILACLRAWEDKDFCRTYLGVDAAMGSIDLARLNIDGGSIALGHPIGATGARLVLHLLHVLRRNHAKKGIATMCIGGGQGGAILVENLAEVEP